MMSDGKEIYIGGVEQEIRSMMETANREMSDIIFKGIETNKDELFLNIKIKTLYGCIQFLAKEIDKLARPTK